VNSGANATDAVAICKQCGKAQPAIMDRHVSEICWCGYKRIGKRKWVYDGYAGHFEGKIEICNCLECRRENGSGGVCPSQAEDSGHGDQMNNAIEICRKCGNTKTWYEVKHGTMIKEYWVCWPCHDKRK
jgi:hypothetical protein